MLRNFLIYIFGQKWTWFCAIFVFCMVGCWHGYLSGAMCRFAYGPADTTATHCLLLQLNPDWFYLSGTGSPGWSWTKGMKRVNACMHLISAKNFETHFYECLYMCDILYTWSVCTLLFICASAAGWAAVDSWHSEEPADNNQRCCQASNRSV